MDKGAHFFRCDFQVHTPRDLNWDGPNCVTDAERGAFAKALIAAARAKGLQAIAITDHHDVVMFPFVREAAANETGVEPSQRIVVYPGVELTLALPCQALLIFDADISDALLSTALTKLSITPTAVTAAKTAQVQKLPFKGLSEIYERLNESREFVGKFIVFPHVGDGGHQTLLRSGFEAHYKGMPCVGGYTDGIATLGKGAQRIVSGEDANYGNKKIAVIQTSDSRSIKFDKLGTATAWIKWTAPTAEALRQACLSDKSRITLADPVFPKARILSITVSDSAFLGPLDLSLNPQYNAFIGGRGTGKSSALEYLRWGLCDQPVDVAEDEVGDIPNYAKKRDLLIEGTLKSRDAVVTVDCELNGVKHSVRRETKTGKVEVRVGSGEWVPATEQEIRDKFPIQAYSQKQLSSVGVLPTEIERLVTAEIASKVEGVNTGLRLLADSIRQLWTQNQRKATLLSEVAREESQLASERAQVEALRGQLKGLSPEDQALLGQAAGYSQQQTALDELLKLFTSLKTQLASQKSTIEALTLRLPKLDNLPSKAKLDEIAKAIQAEISAVTRAQGEAIARVADGSDVDRSIKDAADAVKKVQADFNHKYEDAKTRSTSHQSSLTELARLEASVDALGKSIETRKTAIGELGDPGADLVARWKEWVERHRERSELIKKQCERLEILSGGAFRARATACGSPEPIKEALDACFAGKNIKKVDEKVESLAEAIVASEDPIKTWFDLAGELERLLELRESGALGDTPILEKALLSRANRTSLQETLTPDEILELRLTVLEDRPTFEFRTGPDNYITFAQASSGQQATSLLKVLLNQDGPPLLIDQPEEDLDNEVIQDIAMQIWDTKSMRQLLFVSHNANIVVNGDAELVVCFDYVDPKEPTRGHVKIQGAIDIDPVRESVKRVMEGGDKAFELRRQKYGF